MSSSFDIETTLSQLPSRPGVYRMYSEAGALLYVGKAKVLKNRVRSYFQSRDRLLPKVAALMEHVHHFDYILTDSEVEALILECNLIKKHQPKYNILLRDDKKYPWLALSNEPFPRLYVTRSPVGSARFFGPYASAGSMFQVLKLLRTHFPLRQRKKPLFKNRPCINYFIGACPAPCQDKITPEEYQETVKQVTLFLKGKTEDLLRVLEQDMQAASEALFFERAAKLRDRYQAVQEVVSLQKVFYPDTRLNQDVVAFSHDARRCSILILMIRQGKLIGSYPQDVLLTNQSLPEEAYNTFLTQHYQMLTNDDLPDELVLQTAIEDERLLQDLLTQKKGSRVKVTVPQHGKKKDLLNMAVRNAEELLENAAVQDSVSHRNDPVKALLDLQMQLQLPRLPERMECYDISHFQGSQTVASMVVFSHGSPDKKEYRQFKIQTAEGEPDDFASMEEVITRRFKRARALKTEEQSSLSPKEAGWAAPDLVIIDGGKGQLSAAVGALHALGIHDQPMISLAKKFEKVFLPGESRPVILPRDAAALFLLQQIRDEAHRFAITAHRNLRGKKATRSALDTITGIGDKRKKILMTHFQSVGRLKKASLDEISSVPGIGRSIAKTVYDALHASG